MRLRDLVPPIAASALQRLRPGYKKKQYVDYAQALIDCSEHGYENNNIVNVVIEKTRRYRDDLALQPATVKLSTASAFSLCSLLASSGQNEIRVLDFGGAAGAHYFMARAVLAPSCRLSWIVVETPAMVERARPVFSSDELRFSSNLRDAANSLKHIDLLHSSGALQCVDAPYDYLREFMSTSAKHILFNRLGLTKGRHEIITIHESWLSWNGPGPMPNGIVDRKVRYPFVFPRQAVFMEMLSAHYQTIMTFEDSSGIFPMDDEPLVGLGLLVRRKA